MNRIRLFHRASRFEPLRAAAEHPKGWNTRRGGTPDGVGLRSVVSAPLLVILLFSFAGGGCASQWKIQGGPQECVAMCNRWGLQFTAMVGVGNQDASGEGATACVCQVPARVGAAVSGGAGASTSLAAPIVAEAAAAAQATQQRQLRTRPPMAP